VAGGGGSCVVGKAMINDDEQLSSIMQSRLCDKWEREMKQLERYASANKLELFFIASESLSGWLDGFYDACHAAKDFDTAELVNTAAHLLIYRRHITLENYASDR